MVIGHNDKDKIEGNNESNYNGEYVDGKGDDGSNEEN
jgi:hypothetical protein